MIIVFFIKKQNIRAIDLMVFGFWVSNFI